MVALFAFSSTSALAGSTAGGSTGGGGSNTSPWLVTTEKFGMDTFTFPKSDSQAPGGYRMSTTTYDWATNQWTADGVSIPYNAGMPVAAWNTPINFTGSAHSTGTITYKVKYVGGGTAPTYMYLALSSTASAAELSEVVPATVSGSNGQGDPFIISAGGAGVSTGTHAKRLKLGTNGEATYSVTMNASATKTAKIATLGASSGVSHDLLPKALSLFIETSKRSPESGGITGPVIAVRASTGDIEHEKAEFGLVHDFVLGYGLFNTIPVSRIGFWFNPESNFSSSISNGSRMENGGLFTGVESISTLVYYSVGQAVAMRESPATVVLSAQQTDTGNFNPGPFNSELTMRIWAPERIIAKTPVTVTTETPVTLANGDTMYSLPPNMTGHLVINGSSSQTASATVSLSRGADGSISVPGDLVSLGVSQDVGVSLGYSWTWTVGGGVSWDIAAVSDRHRYYKVYSVAKRYNNNRLLGYYTAVNGYSGDFSDTVTDVKAREQYHEPREVDAP